MQKHIKVYREFYGIGDQDIVLCSICDAVCSDLHHITSRGLKGFSYLGTWYDINNILNIIPLCRTCHEGAHGGIITKYELYTLNLANIFLHDTDWNKAS